MVIEVIVNLVQVDAAKKSSYKKTGWLNQPFFENPSKARIMKATEVRIGNYYLSAKVNELNSIREITSSDIVEIDISGGRGYSPLPITSDILTLLGFSKTDFYWDKYGSWTMRISEYIEEEESAYLILCQEFVICQVAYVHKLQNFYFAVTGEELTLSEV